MDMEAIREPHQTLGFERQRNGIRVFDYVAST